MISLEIVDYLNDDSTLTALLGASGSDTKIYPVQTPQDATQPYVVFNVPSIGGLEENIHEASISFDSVADDYITAENIRDRISTLLDVQDKIGVNITNTDYKYLWSKRIGGAEFKEPKLRLYHRASIYDFKYVPFDFLLQETGYYLLQETGYKIRL